MKSKKPQQGALLIEVLVSIVICAFGLLGYAAMQARAAQSEYESYQRSQALLLVDDMVNRINANRANAASYVTNGVVGGGATSVCNGASIASRDLCEWTNLIQGSSEVSGSNNVGAMPKARGCVSLAAGTTDRYIVSVFWEGAVPTAGSAASCNGIDTVYTDATLRRAVSSTLCVALLTGDAAASRC